MTEPPPQKQKASLKDLSAWANYKIYCAKQIRADGKRVSIIALYDDDIEAFEQILKVLDFNSEHEDLIKEAYLKKKKGRHK